MQSLSNLGKLSPRAINVNQSRLLGMIALAMKDSGLKLVPTASNNLQQSRNYDRERKYNYTDRRYEKDWDLHYDKPTTWTVHPNFKLRMHFEEHSHQRGRSILTIVSAMFLWLFLVDYLVGKLPHPPEYGREGLPPTPH